MFDEALRVEEKHKYVYGEEQNWFLIPAWYQISAA